MSKFDFAQLREQIRKTNEQLKETFRTTDNRMLGNQQATITRKNDPELWQKQKLASQEAQKRPDYRKNYLEGNNKKYDNPEYWKKYYEAIEKRDSDQEYHKRRVKASNATLGIKIQTPMGEFDTISEAARAYGMTSEGMRHRVNSDKYPDFVKIQK